MKKQKGNDKTSSTGKKVLVGIILIIVWFLLINFTWNILSPTGFFDFLIFSLILGIITIIAKAAYGYITDNK
ncbi:hypothetical protein [Flavobacteriaceae bacterium 14752]|uniref:hypothetical protein n=1 Tax=Mesohalobacter salilacus TaxID=2491711 RepID=UPI000F62D41A|nr:hypothetical protein EIG84_12180 [Flavobacteriaceae bacterium 14752]